MDKVTSGDDLRDAARLARECVVLGRAVALGRWIGTGTRPVTPGLVLRKADVPAVGAALGVHVPAKLRTMADLPALHRPWCFAVAAGLLQIGEGQVTGGLAVESWPPADADLLAGWLAALVAVCAAESNPREEDGVRLLALALLTVMDEGRRPANSRGDLWSAMMEVLPGLADRYGKWLSQLMDAHERYVDWKTGDRLAGLVPLLAEFGALADEASPLVITPLGRWAAVHLAEGLPAPADPEWPAGEMIAAAAQFSDEEQQAHVGSGWMEGRDPAEAAREILTAAEKLSPRLRGVAVDLVDQLGEDALPAWRELAAAPYVGQQARAVLAAWDEGPEPSDADWRWLGVEAAAVALEAKGPDEVLSQVSETMPGADLDAQLAAVRATGHPEAEAVAQVVAEFAASGAPRSIDQVAELKISLPRARPPIWRRVQLPVTVTLADLHYVIQILFGWDGGRLHDFTVGNVRYAVSFVPREGVRDADGIRVRDALTPSTRKISYTYDARVGWEHEITLQKTLERDPERHYPVCTGFAGDSPVEYWSEEEPEDPAPFGLAEVNLRLAALVERE